MPEHNILLVDDENNILNALRRLLHRDGHRISSASSGRNGLRILREKNISLVISDQKMPEMDGVEFLHEVKNVSPDTMRIMLTGYADIKTAMEAINKGEIYRFITKPWNDLEIKRIIHQALRQYELVKDNERLHELTKKQNAELLELNSNLEKKVEERTIIISQKKDELDRLYKELEKNFFDSIRVFVGILELYSPSFGNHSKRTALLARMMAKEAGLKEKDIESVDIAAAIHDIGMIGMPKEISEAKQDSLEGLMRNTYEQHPLIGQITIKHIQKLDTIGEIIRSHHERFDGSGFPDRLKGDSIPLPARIIAVADFYDEARTLGLLAIDKSDNNAIRQLIKKNSDKMFDPFMVKMLFNVLDNLKKRHIKIKERAVSVEDLAEGMVISRDIKTNTGLSLIAKGTILNEIYISKIKNYKELGYIGDKVYTY